MLLLGALALAAPAGAAVRYAAPDGAGASPCNPTPCSLAVAVSGAVGGDEVVMAPGTYTEPGLKVDKSISLGGQPGQPATLRTGGDPLEVENEGAVVHDLRVELSAMTMSTPLYLSSGTVERTYAEPAELGGFGCIMETGILRDSVCRTGIFVTFNQPKSVQAHLANVTADPVIVGANGGATMNLDLLNTIALPRTGTGASGLKIDAAAGSAVRVKARNSNYNSVETSLSTGTDFTFTPPGTNGNQTAPPQLVDPAAGDFHQLPTSPTIGAGLGDPISGALDIDGVPRIQGPCAGWQLIDIGAYEFPGSVCPEPPPVGSGSGGQIKRPVSILPPEPGLKLRKVRRHPSQGTATLKAWVPGRGTLSLRGEGIVPRKLKVSREKTLGVVVKAKGAKQKALLRDGEVKVEYTLSFLASDGVRSQTVRPLTLKLRQPGEHGTP